MKSGSGLQGVVVAQTKISKIDGKKGQFIIRGHYIEELVKKSYEEVVYLLWNKKFPNPQELDGFKKKLASQRRLPNHVIKFISKLPKNTEIIDVVLTTLPYITEKTDNNLPTIDQAIALLAKIPIIIASFYRHSTQQGIIDPSDTLSHVENYLYLITGNAELDQEKIKILTTYFILVCEHGMNASTFAARVTTSTQASLDKALASGICTLSGPLHGGAIPKVLTMLDEIGSIDKVENYLNTKLSEKKPIMGFGHRVYKTGDPRAKILKEALIKYDNNNQVLQLALDLEKKVIALLGHKGVYPNVDFWAAVMYHVLKLPRELALPNFTLTRAAGWSAHAIEQSQNNRLIRPLANYVGPMPNNQLTETTLEAHQGENFFSNNKSSTPLPGRSGSPEETLQI